MKIIINIFYIIFITLLLGVAGLFLVPTLPLESNVEMKIVESGSMEPAIKTGSLVIITPTTNYRVGDVITFESRSADIPTTHRIVGITEESGQKIFTTKGDANEEADTDSIKTSDILGKVQVAVPYAGFILDFARQPLGFALLIVLPALMIVFSELEKIWREIRKRRNDKSDGTPNAVARGHKEESDVEVREIVRMIEIGRPIFSYETIARIEHITTKPLGNSIRTSARSGSLYGEILVSVCIIVTSIGFASLSLVGATVSYFNDTESSHENLLRATALDFNVLADGETANSFRTDFIDGETTLITMVESEKDSADAKYTVVAEKMGGTDTFCGAILASSDVPITYDGPLLSLSAEGVSFDVPWQLSFAVAPDVSGLIPNEVCLIDIVYTAWNQDSETGVGYSDVERVQLEFYAPTPALKPEAMSAFSLLEEAESLAGEETTTSSTTEPETLSTNESPEPATDDNEAEVPPTEEPVVEEPSVTETEPPAETPDSSPDPAEIE